MANRLAQASSPYLLQHADNPVDWHEWGPEAFALARETDRPILLSVGYAACHWCHVMAHESFEDAATAAYMNEHFVNVKVDREERPDVDAVYMRAVQAMTGQGGWPMTCVLTPEGEPFFSGTYFPPVPAQGMPAFTQVLQALNDAWTNRRDEVVRIGQQVVDHLGSAGHVPGEVLSAADLDGALDALARTYDEDAGGFGTSPKFPPSMVLEWLLRHEARTGDERATRLADHTLLAMAAGGMHDQLAGGFARYSVDRFWRVPHFEKMLYDNAQLARVYTHASRRGEHAERFRRVATDVADFLLRDLRTSEGGFASALDADTEGVEGATYVWTAERLVEVLGPDDGAWAAEVFTVTEQGTFEHGTSTLQLLDPPADDDRLDRVRARLLEARGERPQPAIDDKVVAAWNGLAISALAEMSVVLERPDYLDAARAAGELLATVHTTDDGRLLRVSRHGRAGAHAGVLEDYGCVAEAYLVLLGVTGDRVWFERAQALLEQVLDRFAAEVGFHDTDAEADALLVRPQDPADNAYPSGTSAVVHDLLAMAAVTGEERWREAAESGVRSAAGVARQDPRFAGWTLAAAEALLAGPLEVALVGSGDELAALQRTALTSASPGAVVVAGEPGLDVPLFAERGLLDGRATAYVCRRFVCDRPVTTPQELAALLGG
ncbi:thioredoxin domain-containing protein [Aeromicrobium massiliense]|uniref:thioredoxin domain-containing protein n=1 Tax=Aeromicrobium massiliense TaxID=1464554 RepID=UPI00057822B7|nr:thioredoxin domain-containing protein [Aeromicrobium massiliense]